MRRPPQPWEARLARLTSIIGGVGLSASGDGTSPIGPTPVPGDGGGGVEPAPVLPPPGRFIKPSTPTLTGAVQGIRVRWDGLNSAGELWPYDTSYIEVHQSTAGTGFTVGSATLIGQLNYPGEFFAGGLSAGTTYHFRFRGADPAGNYTDPSDAASGQTGLTTSGDYGTATINQGAVSFNARQIGGVTSTVGTATPTSPVVGDIWLDTTGGATTHKRWNGTTWEVILFGSGSIASNAITEVKIDTAAVTAAKLAGSAVTETKIASDAVTSPKILAGAVTAAKITAGAVTAEKIAASAVEADKIAANAVTAAKISANTITGDKIAANTITSSLIAANTITATNIATGAITAGAIAAGAVTAAKVDADAINGMTITGSTIRTSTALASGTATGAGVVIDTSGLRGYNASASETFNLNASTGDVLMTGSLRTGTSGARIEMGSYFGVISTVNVYGASGLVGSSGISINGNYRVAAQSGYNLELDGDKVLVDATLECVGTATATTFRPEADTIIFQGYRTTATAGDVMLRLNSNVTNTNEAKFQVEADGDVLSRTNSYAGYSDARYKDNITPARDYLEDLRQVDVVTYNWQGSDQKLLGVIAQQLQPIFPSMVAEDQDGTLSVRYSVFVPMLITAVQSLADKVDNLTARIEALEGN